MEDDTIKTERDVATLRGRMEDGLRAARKEIYDGDRALREAIYSGDQALRKDINEGLASIRKELWDREVRNMKIWALIFFAVFLGMAARGFHWI